MVFVDVWLDAILVLTQCHFSLLGNLREIKHGLQMISARFPQEKIPLFSDEDVNRLEVTYCHCAIEGRQYFFRNLPLLQLSDMVITKLW